MLYNLSLSEKAYLKSNNPFDAEAIAKLKIVSRYDLLTHYPVNYCRPVYLNSELEISTVKSAGDRPHPLYKEVEINQVIENAVRRLLNNMSPIGDFLPNSILEKYKLMPLDTAFRQIHFPDDRLSALDAHRRFVFNELFLIQCGLMLIKLKNIQKGCGVSCNKSNGLLQKVIDSLPFELTRDQYRTFKDVSRDMEADYPMRRLVQGDVGSGKTVVAMLALVKAVENGYQGAMMAPTEILAVQHYNDFQKKLGKFGIKVGLLSAKVTRSKKARTEIYEKIANHEYDIIVGTQALIQKDVVFDKLGLVIVDEQHRFGVNQRAMLSKKSNEAPNILAMSATPIPRTISLTVYGDLDVSLIKQIPPGRKPIKTEVKSTRSRESVYKFAKAEILKGRQVYVVCPLISRKSKKSSEVISADELYQKLRKGIFKNIPCALIHGKTKVAERDEIMQRFSWNEIKLIVSTTVIEVGVNVPNATVIIIENAERFGLAQLHQLRGRVGRGSEKSYCILISSSKEGTAKARLDLMEKTTDGFELAEEDLKLRGAGQLFGESQHGLPDLKIAKLFDNLELLLDVKSLAERIVYGYNRSTYRGRNIKIEYFDRHYLARIKEFIELEYGEIFQNAYRD